MKREEKVNELVRELISTVNEKQNKKCATIVLSLFGSEDGERIGEIIAATGTIVGLTTVIAKAMDENEIIKKSIMMAAKFHSEMGAGIFPFSSLKDAIGD